MKKHLLLIGAWALAALTFTACSSDNDDDPKDPTYLWMIEKIVNKDDPTKSFIFTYNSDYSLKSVTESGKKVTTYTYGTDSKLSKVTKTDPENVTIEITFAYDGMKITSTRTEGGNQTSPTIYTLDNNGKLIQCSMIFNAADPFTDLRREFKYDDKGKLSSYSEKTYIDGEAQGPSMMNPQYLTSYKYDNKNSMVHKGMLPDWYLSDATLPLISGYKLSPINNVTESNLEGGNFSGATNYGLAYNEEGYPTEYYTLNLQGGKIEDSIYNITYKKVEITE